MCTGLRINLIAFIYYMHILKQYQMFMIWNHSIYFFIDYGHHWKDSNLVRIIKEYHSVVSHKMKYRSPPLPRSFFFILKNTFWKVIFEILRKIPYWELFFIDPQKVETRNIKKLLQYYSTFFTFLLLKQWQKIRNIKKN